MIPTTQMRKELEALDKADEIAWMKLKATMEWQLWNEVNMKRRNIQDAIAAAETLNRRERVA